MENVTIIENWIKNYHEGTTYKLSHIEQLYNSYMVELFGESTIVLLDFNFDKMIVCEVDYKDGIRRNCKKINKYD